MYIEETTREASEAREGVWREPWNSYWESWLIFDGVVYDLGRFGNGAEAGIAYAKALMAFRENANAASGITRSDQSHAAGVGHYVEVGPAGRVGGLHSGCAQQHRLPVPRGSEVAR